MKLPNSWAVVKLNDFATLTIGGDWGKDENYQNDDFVTVFCIRGSEFRNWNENKGSTASIRKIKKSSLQNRRLIKGDILVEISGGGPEQPVGRTVLIDNTVLSFSKDIPKVCTNFLRLLRTTDKIDSSFLNLYLSFFYQSGKIRGYQGGSNNLRNLRFNDYLGLDIPVAPLPEQHRIVAKIEALFSELDKGIESLRTAREQLKTYRQALLKHAFSGKLTAQWRAENQGKLETAEALLQRIQTEREQRYQQQLTDWEANGKQGGKPKAPKTLPPLTAEELMELPELPEGWIYSKLGAIIDEPTYGTAKKCDYETMGVGVLRIPNVVSGKIDASDLKYAQFSDAEIASYKLKAGDILLIRSNGSVSIVGRCALISNADIEYLYAGYLIMLRPNQTVIVSAYLLNLFFSHSVRKQIEYKAKSTSGVNNINSGEIQSLVIAVCGIEEQILDHQVFHKAAQNL